MKKKKVPAGWKKCKPLPKRRIVGKQPRAERYEMFCLEYSKDENGARAARAAGYSEAAAKEQATYLLTKPHIKARIKQIIDERNARVLMEGDDILREIQKLGKSDVRRLFNHKTGAILPMAEWPDDVAVCVASIKVKELYSRGGVLLGFIKEVKLWDKPKPLEMMGRNKRLFVDVVESKNQTAVTVTDADEVKKIVKAVEDEC